MTVAQLQKLRVGVGHAIWGRKDCRNASAALLLLKHGVGDPYVARALRIARRWAEQVYTGRWGEVGGPACWERIRGHPRRIQGPAHMMQDLLRQWGFYSPGGAIWTGGGYTARIDEHPDLSGVVLEAARDVRWAALGKRAGTSRDWARVGMISSRMPMESM